MFLANKGQWKLKILKALASQPPVHSKLLGLGVLSATSGNLRLAPMMLPCFELVSGWYCICFTFVPN